MKTKLLIFALLLVPMILLAQVEPPTGWADVIVNYKTWFASMGAVAVLTTFLVTFMTGLFQIASKIGRQLVSWGTAIVLLVLADLFDFGYVAEFPILMAVIHGLAIGLISNGVYDIAFWKSILNAIEGWIWPVKPATKKKFQK